MTGWRMVSKLAAVALTTAAFTTTGAGAQVVAVDNGGLIPVSPHRVVDTRDPGESRLGAGQVLRVPVWGHGGVPAGASAVFANVTAVLPGGPGHLTVYECGSRPNASNVNYSGGDVAPNAVLAKVSAAGEICVWTHAASDVIVDLAGYVPPPPGSELSVIRCNVYTEEVDIRNTTSGTVDLAGWILHDDNANFSVDLGTLQSTLGGNQTLTVLSGPDAHSKAGPNRVVWTTRNIWRNSGDTAVLISPSNTTTSLSCPP